MRGIKVAYEALSWGRHVNEFTQAWEAVTRADAPNLGLGLDSFHVFATKTPLEMIDLIDPEKIFLVQLADFMWQEIRSVEERITTARTFRVFPGEGAHSEQVAALVCDGAARTIPNGRTRLFVIEPDGQLREIGGDAVASSPLAEALVDGRIITALDPAESYELPA